MPNLLRRRRVAAAAAVLAVLAGCGGSAGGGHPKPATATGRPSPPTTEEPVAALALAAMDDRSGNVGEYRGLLAELAPRCQELPNRIADLVVDAQQRMADHARVESMITVLRAIVDAVPPGFPPTECAAAAVAVANRLAP